MSSDAGSEESGPPAEAVDVMLAADFPALPTAARPVFSGAWGAKAAPAGGAAPARPAAPATPGDVFSLPPQSVDPKARAGGAAEAVRDVLRALPGTEVKVAAARTGVLTFVVRGKSKDDVARARRMLCAGVGVRSVQRFAIPASARPHLIGAQGRTLKALVNKCLVEIQIPKQAPRPDGEQLPEDDDEETEITITGDVEGIEMARKDIEAIVMQRASKTTQKVAVPSQFHPFIQQGAAAISAETGARIHIPPLGTKGDDDIIVNGDRDAVRKAASMLAALHEDARANTTTMKVAIPKKQHRYLMGSRASNLQEILEKTGCAVEVPPADRTGPDGEEVVVRGPSAKLIEAITLVLEKSNAYQADSLDVAALLPRKSDAAVFARFIGARERAALRKIESDHEGAEVRLHGTVLDVVARSKPALAAALADLRAFLAPLAAGLEFDTVEVPSALHGHVVGKGGQGVARLRARIDEALGTEGALADLVLPHRDEEAGEGEGADEIVVVAKQIPGRPDAMEKIKAELLREIEKMADLTTVQVPVDQKYHGRIIGSGGLALRKFLAPYEGSVSVKFPQAGDAASSAGAVSVRGPADKAADCAKRLRELVDEWKHQEIMCSYQEEVRVPRDSARRILGAQKERDEGAPPPGSWIVRAVKDRVAADRVAADREKHPHATGVTDRDVSMTRFEVTSSDAKEDVITVTGHKRAVELAREIIADRAQKLADTVVVAVSIPARFHPKLIGKGGKVVGKLMELYNVFVKFPSKHGANGLGADGEEEAEDRADEDRVTIRGFKGDVEKAKKELLELAAYEEEHSHSLTFTVPSSLLPRIVGRKGATVQQIKEDTDTRIDFDRQRGDPAGEEGEGQGEVTVTVEGPKAGCEEAKKKILEIVNDQLDVAEQHIKVPRKLHRVIIGPSGTAIRKLVAQWAEELGVPLEKIQVRFLKDDSDDVLVRTPVRVLEEVVSRLQEEVKKHEAAHPTAHADEGAERIEEELLIPKTDVARVVGRKGETITGIADKHGVDIQISHGREVEEGDQVMVGVKVSGYSREAIDGAKADILSKLRTSDTVEVPMLVLPFLENDRGLLRSRTAGPDAQPVGVEVEGTKLVIRGDRGVVDGIKAAVAAKVDEMVGPCAVLLPLCANSILIQAKYAKSAVIVIAPHIRPHIIGRQGATIIRMRKDSGCMVDIFPSEKVGEAKGQFAVVILGESDEDVAKAKAMVDKILRDQTQDALSHAQRDESTVLKRLAVPVRHHRRLIGPKGSGILEIQTRVGMPVNVQFPRVGATTSDIEIRGSAEAVEACIRAITEIVTSWDEVGARSIAVVPDVEPERAPRAETPKPAEQEKEVKDGQREGPPGWSGRAAKGKGGRPPSSATASPLPPEQSPVPPAPSPAPPKQDGEDEWKVIGGKRGKGGAAPTPEPPKTVPGAPPAAAAPAPAAPAPSAPVVASAPDPSAPATEAPKPKKKKGVKKAAPAAGAEADGLDEFNKDAAGSEPAVQSVPSDASMPELPASLAAPPEHLDWAAEEIPMDKLDLNGAPPADEWQTVGNTVQRFKQKKLQEAAAAPAAPAPSAAGSQRNVFGVLEEPAQQRSGKKKK
ncbi:hypothetical protein DFJ74DRAFT_5815 [Hyaloraphidium curvatum]|nr:hypothetical protein DFJ74DRAFT_5815 [Hyaloraphidium curvatum]